MAYQWNLSQEQYEVKLAEQGGGCGICGRTPSEHRAKRAFAIDHDHRCCRTNSSCGKCLRGILCGDCNGGLGFFQDDPLLLLKALTYLLRWRRLHREDPNPGPH
ncbi:endonuclease domain-containing protein [Kocuria kalidii]|uniref:endonuclease domain-containing protein n=1 Tax=Kocuria kalidii TaxID=3376283 RepID=UPI00379F347A